MQVSLDCYMASESGSTSWMVWNWGPVWTWDKDLQQYHTELNQSANTILISGQMAQEGFIGHWKQAALRDDEQTQFARHIVQSAKVVISNTLTKAISIPGGWDRVEICGDLQAAVLRLKKESSGAILVYGGATLVSSLIKLNLIDEMHLLVNPVAIARGKSVFDHLQEPLHLSLVKTRAFSCGVVALHYQLKT